MSKTPKADALRRMREQRIDEAFKRWADDKRASDKRSQDRKKTKRRGKS